jgi:hypothetical protein
MKHFPDHYPPQARIEEGSIPEPNSGCWLWLGNTNLQGYAHLTHGGKMHRANRFSWVAYNSKIPPDLHVLHRCDNRLCVNPEHLFLGTNQDNVDDRVRKGRSTQFNALKTHCKQGHQYTEENTYRQKNTNQRACLICRRAQSERFNLNRKQLKGMQNENV